MDLLDYDGEEDVEWWIGTAMAMSLESQKFQQTKFTGETQCTTRYGKGANKNCTYFHPLTVVFYYVFIIYT